MPRGVMSTCSVAWRCVCSVVSCQALLRVGALSRGVMCYVTRYYVCTLCVARCCMSRGVMNHAVS